MVSRIKPRPVWECSGSFTRSWISSGVMVWGCNLRQRNSSMLIKGTISQKQVSVWLIPLPSGLQWPSARQVSGKRAWGHVAGRWGQQEISQSSCPARLPECSEHHDPYDGGSAGLLLPQSPSLSSVELIPQPGMSYMVPSIETMLEMMGGWPVASDGTRRTKSFGFVRLIAGLNRMQSSQKVYERWRLNREWGRMDRKPVQFKSSIDVSPKLVGHGIHCSLSLLRVCSFWVFLKMDNPDFRVEIFWGSADKFDS